MLEPNTRADWYKNFAIQQISFKDLIADWLEKTQNTRASFQVDMHDLASLERIDSDIRLHYGFSIHMFKIYVRHENSLRPLLKQLIEDNRTSKQKRKILFAGHSLGAAQSKTLAYIIAKL